MGVAGEGMMFGSAGRTFAEITDGSSNTAWIVEANQDQAVTWTEPRDWTPNESNPMEGLGRVNPGGFIVTFVDGSVRFINNRRRPENMEIAVDHWRWRSFKPQWPVVI